MTFPRHFLATATLFLAGSLAAHAQPTGDFAHSAQSFADPLGSPLCLDGECQPAITNTTYFGRPAFRLTDGRTQAVVVPALGRVMSYGKVGGANLLWNSPTFAGLNWGWKNYGGEKTWLSPQSSWAALNGKAWPPDTAIDGTPHSIEVLTGGKLKMVSGTSKTSGISIERTMWFNEAGEFEIQQTAVKSSGAPVKVGLWSIAQSVPAQSVFVPVAADSAYKGGHFWFDHPGANVQTASVASGVLRLEPQAAGGGEKIGVDAPVAALASVRDGVAWVQRSVKSKGEYPDGTTGRGCPVEVYVNGDAKNFYVELEMLGPLVDMVKGQRATHTVKWSLHDLPSKNVDDAGTQSAVAALLQ